MNFSQLPYDIHEQILDKLDRDTLLPLCLVSKSTLELARPFLYRSVEIYVDFWDVSQEELAEHVAALREIPTIEEDELLEEEEDEVDFEREWKAVARGINLHETLKLNSGTSALVQQITLIFDYSGFRDPELALRLWSTFPNVHKISISGKGWSDFHGECMHLTCPRTITSLDLEHIPVAKNQILELLKELPLLEYLKLPRNIIHSSLPNQAPHLQNLQCITWRFVNPRSFDDSFRDTNFFALLTKYTPSLSSLNLDFRSVQAIVPSHLSTLRYMSIFGVSDFSEFNNEKSSRESEILASLLLEIFVGCTSLAQLKITDFSLAAIFPSESPSTAKELEHLKAPHKLAPSLEVLSLSGMKFSPSYLFEFVSSRSTSLRRLHLSRFEGRKPEGRPFFESPPYETTAEDEMETICAAQGIELTWVQGRRKEE
ncbi:F-box protein [Sporobolomyces salmoneus]|uniref:F-box protein n=1 Tax=Sporobolomyces salmoneus TaxID=183962 RepID=UPI00318022AE